MIERKTLAFEAKADDANPGTVELYAAVFGNVDRVDEVIEPGAFVNLDEFVKSGWLAKNHDWDDLPIASIEAAAQDGIGLKILARWHSHDDAQDCRTVVRERMDRGKAVKCSIGYRVLKDAMETRGEETVRVLKEIELYEASIVNLPANPEAHVTGVKHWADELDLAYRALKAGRVLSRASRDRLCKCRDAMKEAHDELHRMLEETDVDTSTDDGAKAVKPEPVSVVPAPAGNVLIGEFLAHEARYPMFALEV